MSVEPGLIRTPQVRGVSHAGTHRGPDVRVVPGGSPLREEWETAIERAGLPFSLPHRGVWDRVAGARQAWLIVATDGGGAPSVALTARAYPSRALPFHSVLRVERFRARIGAPTESALRELRRLAERIPRVLRVHVELFDPTGASLPAASEAARSAGFEKWPNPRLYDRTVILDLGPDVEALFRGLHPTGRRHVRSLSKNPVTIRPVEPGFPAAVLDGLVRETLERTGGTPAPHAWREILELSARRPDLSRIVGLFASDRPDPEGLLAFAWACHHGDHAHYATAASTRFTELKIPMSYPLAWDLIVWAKRHGAALFDFGGISSGTAASGDPLGGISDFKRRFTDCVLRVSEEWVYEPHPGRARLAGWAARAGVAWRRSGGR
jgi:hypothetical protein